MSPEVAFWIGTAAGAAIAFVLIALTLLLILILGIRRATISTIGDDEPDDIPDQDIEAAHRALLAQDRHDPQ